MKQTFLKLEACNPSMCFSGRLMRMDRIISSIFRKHIAPFELTNSQLSILFVIAKKEIVIQQQLAETLFLEKSSLSRNIKRLLETALIEKINTKQIQVTEKGKALLERIIPHWEKAMDEVKELLGDDGQNAFNTVYQKIKN